MKNNKKALVIKPINKSGENAQRYQKPVAVKLGSVLLIKGNNHFKSDFGAGKAVGLL